MKKGMQLACSHKALIATAQICRQPSLNNLWFEACNSHLCGNYQAAIISTSVLLEFALRMVVSNLEDVPSIREDHDEMFGKQTLGQSSIVQKVKGFYQAIQKSGGMLTVSIFETRFAIVICSIFSMTAEKSLSSLIISIQKNHETTQHNAVFLRASYYTSCSVSP